MGYSPWGPKELDTTEQANTFTFIFPTHRLGMVFLKMLIMPALEYFTFEKYLKITTNEVKTKLKRAMGGLGELPT